MHEDSRVSGNRAENWLPQSVGSPTEYHIRSGETETIKPMEGQHLKAEQRS